VANSSFSAHTPEGALRPFELFAFWRSSATYRVRVALNLKGLTAHERLVNIDQGEQHDPDFLRLNPLGAIPAFLVPGHPPLTQSLAILEYLDELEPTPPLLPQDLHGRARVRSLAAMLAGDTHPLITPRIKKYLMGQGGFDEAAWRAWQVQWFGTGLRAVEQRLVAESVPGKFCHGDKPTLADICLASVIAVTRVFKISFDDLPTVDRVIAACDSHEAFVKAEPFRQQGAPAS
jgi:maleylacetoacetate isomerase